MHQSALRPISSAAPVPVDSSSAFQGHLDRFAYGVLEGWVYLPSNPQQAVTLTAYYHGVLLGTARADGERADLRDLGIGTGSHGFRISFNGDVLSIYVDDADNHVNVFAHTPELSPQLIFRIPPTAATRAAASLEAIPKDFLDTNINPLIAILIQQAHQLNHVPSLSRLNATSHDAAERDYHELFRPIPSTDQALGGRYSPRPRLSRYVQYIMRRSNADQDFFLDSDPFETDRLLRWYIQNFGPSGRIPLSAEELAYLNGAVYRSPSGRQISRLFHTFYLENPNLRSSLATDDDYGYLLLAYWWSVELAWELKVEDCLVPDYFVDFLRMVPNGWLGKELPLSHFVEVYHSRKPDLHSASLHDTGGRLAIYLYLLLCGPMRPDFLRYIPDQVLATFFASPDGGACLFDELLAASSLSTMSSPSSHLPGETREALVEEQPAIDAQTYRDLLLTKGFDLTKGAFTFLDAHGNRIESAARTLHTYLPDGQFDVQVIGPFAKASGLGQACRLTGEIVSHTKYRTNLVDFGLDNPAKEGFSDVGRLGSLGRARVNLLSLNAESIPTVYAYLPDVFSGSYNIGFFYWELDSPASCHSLALDLLHEVWVASEYGVGIYKPHTDKPVVNVGMAFQDVGELHRDSARRFVEDRYPVHSDTFVFLATFDAMSFIQRKNPHGTVAAFQRAFPNAERVKLIIKSHNSESVVDPAQKAMWRGLRELIGNDRRIVLVDRTMTYRELVMLKAGSDCYVSLHTAEGWGFGILEAMALGVPVVCTAYSGNMDFCDSSTAWLVDYQLAMLRPRDYIFVSPGQQWAVPRIDSAAEQMRLVYDEATERRARAERAKANVRSNFSVESVARRFENRLSEILESRDPSASGGLRRGYEGHGRGLAGRDGLLTARGVETTRRSQGSVRRNRIIADQSG